MIICAKQLRKRRILHAPFDRINLALTVISPFKKLHAPVLPVINPLKISVGSDRPVHGIRCDPENVFNFLEQIKWIFRGAVHFIDESKNRNAAHFTNVKQFYGLRLYALRAVDQHDRTVRGHQRPVRVLGKVLMARRIQNVDAIMIVFELKHG